MYNQDLPCSQQLFIDRHGEMVYSRHMMIAFRQEYATERRSFLRHLEGFLFEFGDDSYKMTLEYHRCLRSMSDE